MKPIKKSFTQAVYEVVRKIPSGATLSYQEVAKRAGYPKACRAVGNALNRNFDPQIPCHRVIRSDGKTGGYNRGQAAKARLLRFEAKHVE